MCRLESSAKQRIVSVACCAMLAILSGQRVMAADWVVGNVVVCVGSGQCRIYSSPTAFETISTPSNPRKDTGGSAWSSLFELYVVDSTNQKVFRFSKTGTHAVNLTIDTSSRSTGHPGPVVVDSAGSLYVGMLDANTILKYDRNGNWVTTISTGSAGPVSWGDLANDHQTFWFTSSLTPRQIQRLNLSNLSVASLDISGFGAGTAAAVRLLPPYDGSNVLLADGLNIKRLTVSGNTVNAPQTYDIASPAEDAWRVVTLEADEQHFLAATAAGKVYRFDLTSGVGALLTDTLSAKVSALSEKGGAQLNIRPLNFSAGAIATDQKFALFGNPAATGAVFPPHGIGVMYRDPTNNPPPTTPLVASANWVTRDGQCLNSSDPNDVDCRTTTSPGGFFADAASLRCIPYVSADDEDCVFYRLEDDSSTGKTLFIEYREPSSTYSYVHPACTGDTLKGNPRMLEDPNPLTSPYQFEEDITVGILRTSTDPIAGSGGRGSDYAGFDRCSTDGIATAGNVHIVITNPAQGATKTIGSSVPFAVYVVDNKGTPSNTADDRYLTDAVNVCPNPPTNPSAPCYSLSLFVRHETTGTNYLQLDNPGNSKTFFSPTTIKVGKLSIPGYGANWDTSQIPASDTGSYTACVTSVDLNKVGSGQAPPSCVTFSLKSK